MTTVVVVKRNGQVAIAADTLVTFGDTRLSNRFEANSKLFKVDTVAGPSYVGIAGTVAHFPVLRKAMLALPKKELLLGSKDEVFDTFTKLHPLLKDMFFLQTKEDDNDPYESSQFSVVVANATGIYVCTATAKCLSSMNFGALARVAALLWVRCSRPGAKTATRAKLRARSPPLAFRRAANLTKAQAARLKFSRSS